MRKLLTAAAACLFSVLFADFFAQAQLPLRLYVFDCATLKNRDPGTYGLSPGHTTWASAQLWIQHGIIANAKLKKPPAY